MGFKNMYIAASAGAGKTYQLVSRFITLLCMQKIQGGQAEVNRLIAITFTRKAAGEFKARILEALAAAAISEESAKDFWKNRVARTMKDMGITSEPPPSSLTFFTELLREVMSSFSQLNLSTIDSLFQRMAGGLSDELGQAQITPLDPAAENAQRRAVLSNMYHAQAEVVEQMEQLISLGEEDEEKLSSPDTNLYEQICTYHALYLDNPNALWGGDAASMPPEKLALYGLTPEDVACKMSAEELRAQVEDLLTWVRENEGLFPLPEKNPEGKGCVVGHSPIPIPLTMRSAPTYRQKFIVFLQSLTQIGKSLAYPKDGEEQLLECYPQYLQTCSSHGVDVQALIAAHRALSWCDYLSRTQRLKQLLEQFDAQYEKEVRQRGRLGFGDVARLLSEGLDETALMAIQERMDTKLEHWMLDEFQDTSHEQYKILRELLHSRAQGDDDGSVFMVGDAKQSIYQFRGGDPRIFLKTRSELFGLDTEGQTRSVEEPLNVSYRSAQEVLHLPNLLFGEDLATLTRNMSEGARQQWKALKYIEHKGARSPYGDVPGCVEIWESKKTDDTPAFSTDEESETNEEEGITGKDANTIKCLAALLAETRGDEADAFLPRCAILVETGKQGREIAQKLSEFQEQFHFRGPISLAEDKLVGLDSPLGQALLNLFRWLHRPQDQQSLSLLKISPLWPTLCELAGQARSPWGKLRQMVNGGGIASFLRALQARCESLQTLSDFQRHRWQVWFNAADTFDAQGDSLAEWVGQMRLVSEREESQGNEIVIMTIHKAKGLEFDMVFLPQFASTKSMAQYNRVNLLKRCDEEGGVEAVLLRPSTALLEEKEQVKRCLYEPWHANEEFAGLCKLYVATTRAKMATYIILPYMGDEKDKKSARWTILNETASGESTKGIMLQLAAKYQPNIDDDKDATQRGGNETDPYSPFAYAVPRFTYKNSNWACDVNKLMQQKKRAEQKDEAKTPQELGTYRFRSLARSTPSGLDKDRQSEETADAPAVAEQPLRRVGSSSGANFGTLVHQMMEQVDWLGGTPPKWPAGSTPQAEELVARALACPAWAAAFTRPACPHLLLREQNIEAVMEGVWVSGQIDRLVVEYADGLDKPATAAAIYDFKTDMQLDGSLLKEEYRAQMAAYRRMVTLCFALPLEAVSVTLLACPKQGEPAAHPYTAPDWQ